jgi:hypothetical protein
MRGSTEDLPLISTGKTTGNEQSADVLSSDELTGADYELIKTEAIALICAKWLDSPQAHLDYVSRSVAGALSKRAGTDKIVPAARRPATTPEPAQPPI